MTELKPCPFCGSRDVHFNEYDGMRTDVEYILCWGCGVVVRYGYNRELIEIWNKRAGE
jgi:Lar family restriction alleviation protein